MVLFQWVLKVLKAHQRLGGTHKNTIMRISEVLEHPKKDQEQLMFRWCQLINRFQSCKKTFRRCHLGITFQWNMGWVLKKYRDLNLSGLDLICYISSDYSNQGVDQLQKVIETIKTNPDDRRIIMCAWNPKGIEQLA